MSDLKIIKLLHKFYRADEYIKAFLDVVEDLINNLKLTIIFLLSLLHFNRLDDEGCDWWIKLLDLQVSSSLSTSEKQSVIRSKWRAKGHNCLKLIQNVCNSFENGKTNATFNDGIIGLEFENLPFDLKRLMDLIDEVKPAHLPYGLKLLLKMRNRFYVATGYMECIEEEFDCRGVEPPQ